MIYAIDNVSERSTRVILSIGNLNFGDLEIQFEAKNYNIL